MPIISPSLQGDLKGGAASALLTILLAIGLRPVRVRPAGDRCSQSAIIVPIVALILRAISSVVLAPRSMASFLVSGVIFDLLALETVDKITGPSQLLAVIRLIMLAAGVFQSLFGVMRRKRASFGEQVSRFVIGESCLLPLAKMLVVRRGSARYFGRGALCRLILE